MMMMMMMMMIMMMIMMMMNKLLLLSATSDPRQITGNVSVAEMPLALYNDQLSNTQIKGIFKYTSPQYTLSN